VTLGRERKRRPGYPASSGAETGLGGKERLARSARELVESGGVEGLTLRAAAKAADVTHNAPYFHFPGGITELLGLVAADGFQELLTALAQVPTEGDPLERTRQTVERYVRFGVEKPHLYRAMFHSRLAKTLENPDDFRLPGARGDHTFAMLRQLKAEAFEMLVRPLSDLKAHRRLRRADPREAGLAVAALAHGLVGEFIDEGLADRLSNRQPWSKARREMTAAVTDMLLLGIAVSS